MRFARRFRDGFGPTQVLGLGLVVASAVGAMLGAELRQQRRRTAQLHRSLIDLLLNALTADDKLTARHSHRVANLTDALGDALGLDKQHRSTLRVASLLHDMGKIEDTFFGIVHSRDPLSSDEQKKIQHHPARSAHILRRLERVHDGLSQVVASHHERWDGCGYPRKLRGSAIPLEARLIAMADSFDAMTQPRGYKKVPREPEDGLAEIQRGAGTRYDPRLCQLLDLPAVRERWLEIARQGRIEEERERTSGGAPPVERRQDAADTPDDGEDRRARFTPPVKTTGPAATTRHGDPSATVRGDSDRAVTAEAEAEIAAAVESVTASADAA